jgi:hypothetical protein
MAQQEEVNARLARFAATWDARDLWPHVTAAAFRAAQQEVARVTAAVLSGPRDPVSLRLPPETDIGALGVAASAAGMGPLLGFWCEAGRLAAEPRVAELLRAHLDHGRRRATRLGLELARLLAAFADRTIDVCVLKGMHTGQCYFPEPGTRPVTDIDLLVNGRDGAAAHCLLRDLGFTEGNTREGQHRSDWTPPGDAQPVRSLELAHVDNPWSVDLHVSLDRRLFPGLTARFGSHQPWAVQRCHGFARPLSVLPEPLLFAYLAVHASSHFGTMQLVRLVELVFVEQRDFAGRAAAWTAFQELVARTRTGRFAFPALELAEQLVPGTVDGAVLERLRTVAPRRLRRLVGRVTPGSAQQLHRYPPDPAIVWVASPRELVAYLAHLVWPWQGRVRAPLREVVAIQQRRLKRILHRVLPGRSPY